MTKDTKPLKPLIKRWDFWLSAFCSIATISLIAFSLIKPELFISAYVIISFTVFIAFLIERFYSVFAKIDGKHTVSYWIPQLILDITVLIYVFPITIGGLVSAFTY
jgi:hypothetical protein